MAIRSKLTTEEIQAIINQEDLVLRNLQITVGYYRIARRMRRLVGDVDVNWFAFGVFASKTAGRAIRHELLPKRVKSALIRTAGYDNTSLYLGDVLTKENEFREVNKANSLLSEMLSQVSLQLSLGNRMIFEELAEPFTALTETFAKAWQRDDDQFNAFLDAHLDPRPVQLGGQLFLREAFSTYYEARFETNAKRKAELILLANLLTGLHEQTRLQPVIEKSIALPFDMLTEGLPLGFSRKLVLRAVTRMMMTYALPTREMHVGKAVVAPTGLINFPPELINIEHERCREVVVKFDSGLDTLSGSAAGNWGQLADRMNFLVDFFRAYQRYKPLYQPPFTETQMEAIVAGHIPAGDL